MDVSTAKRRGPEGSGVSSLRDGTEPMIVTIGHHCSGKWRRYSSKSDTSPGCLGRLAGARPGVGRDVPHQAKGLDADLQGAVRGRGGGEAAVGIEEGVRNVELAIFSCEVSMNAGTNGLDVDARAVEAVLLKDVDLGLDLHVVRRVFPARVVGDVVHKVSHVDSI